MSKKIAAFGEVVMRLEVPQYNMLSQTNTLAYSFSGTGVNVLGALAKLGHEVYLVSSLPNNPLGNAAADYIRKLGVSTTYITQAGDYLRMYFLEKGFGFRPSRVTNTSGRDTSFNTATEETYNFDSIAEHIDIVHFCGITLAMNQSVRINMKEFAQAVKRAGGMVVFDCNYRPRLWGANGYGRAKVYYEEMLSLADIVMMNEKDAKYILGMNTKYDDRESQLRDLLPQVAQKYNISIIAGTHRTINDNLTHSLRGYMYKNDQFTFVKPVTFPVLDRIGTGDAYTSAILHGEIKGFSPQKTVAFATSSSMLAHSINGDTSLFTEAEIKSAMEESIADIDR